jgi:phytoene dehydrogenase-like protein
MLKEYFSCIGLMIKYNRILVTDYANTFKDHRLREVMTYMFYEPESPHVPFVFVFQLATMFKKTAGYPEGGSRGVSQMLVDRYKNLGGDLKTRSKVKKVLVKNNRSVGVQLEDGSEHYADYVISACDTRTVIYDMLEGKYVDKNITKLYKDGPIHASVLKVYIGVDKDFSKERDVVVHLLNEPLDIKGLFQNRPRTSLVLRHYCNYDASFAPPGKSVLESFFYSEYDYWKKVYSTGRQIYKLEKQRVADLVIDEIEKIHPGTKDKIEVVDVVTPVTYHRYTGNYKGSVMGWFDDTTIAQDLIKKIGFTLPGLKNFYMTGQWIVTGGMIRAAGSGRYAIEQICRRENEKFKAPAV